MDLKDCLLGDVVTFQRGHDLPKTQMVDGPYPVLGSNGIIGYHNRYTTTGPVIVVGRSGNVGHPFMVKSNAWAHNTSLYIKDFKGNDPIFIYYFLQTLNLAKFAGGSAVPTLNRNHINTIEVKIPKDVSVQQKIGSILASFDEKISTNNKINDNLMQQAETLYRYLFIKNASPKWRTGSMAELVSVRYGKDHKKLADGTIPVYGSGGVMRFVERPLYEHESVLIPRKGSLNNIIYVNQPFWSVDTMFYTEMKLCNVAKYVYFYLKSQNLAAMNVGSAVPSMTTELLNSLQIKIPSNSTLMMFESIVDPMFKTISHNQIEIKKLMQVRDYLLKKLFS